MGKELPVALSATRFMPGPTYSTVAALICRRKLMRSNYCFVHRLILSPLQIGRKHVRSRAAANATLVREVGVPKAGSSTPPSGLLPELVRIFWM